MARRGIFRALENAEPIDHDKLVDEEDQADQAPRRGSPNTKLAVQSIREEDRRATRLISPSSIRMSSLQDRLDPNEGLDDLIASIRDEGQQVPVLVRRIKDGSLEIVYGRRRVLACRALGIDVRASVLEMTDEEALIAQGVENSARLDTSFIERALFVNQISEMGYNGIVIKKATGISETQVYKMRAIVQIVPRQLIMKIGAAHGAGRRQWEALAKACKAASKAKLSAVMDNINGPLSVDRLDQALGAFAESKAAPPAPSKRELAAGALKAVTSANKITLSILNVQDHGFLDHLLEQVPSLYADWNKGRAREGQ